MTPKQKAQKASRRNVTKRAASFRRGIRLMARLKFKYERAGIAASATYLAYQSMLERAQKAKDALDPRTEANGIQEEGSTGDNKSNVLGGPVEPDIQPSQA